MSTRCFLLEPTDQVELSLRRYRSGDAKCYKSPHGYCNVSVVLERLSIADLAARGWPMHQGRPEHGDLGLEHQDPRWPRQCGCGYAFRDDDVWQANPTMLYRRSDGGDLVTLDNAPVGAMWFAPWYSESPEWRGPDGQTLVVRVPPNHDWIIDSRASNCDSPCATCKRPYNKHPHDGGCRYVDARPHKCWVRHGTPPNVHVDKAGLTCGAGGGSIAVPGYHGFLHNGELSDDVDRKRRAPPAAPAAPSPYVRLSEILRKSDGIHQANLADTYARETGQSISQAELDRALKKGRAKGTFLEVAGVWKHVNS